jgi:hypothetical protein
VEHVDVFNNSPDRERGDLTTLQHMRIALPHTDHGTAKICDGVDVRYDGCSTENARAVAIEGKVRIVITKIAMKITDIGDVYSHLDAMFDSKKILKRHDTHSMNLFKQGWSQQC